MLKSDFKQPEPALRAVPRDGDGTQVRALNAAEVYGISQASAAWQAAQERAEAARQQLRKIIAACGLNPDLPFQLKTDGTVVQSPAMPAGNGVPPALETADMV